MAEDSPSRGVSELIDQFVIAKNEGNNPESQSEKAIELPELPSPLKADEDIFELVDNEP